MPGVSAVTAITRHCQTDKPNSRSYSSAIRCETAFDSTDSRNGRKVARRSGAGWGVSGMAGRNSLGLTLQFGAELVTYETIFPSLARQEPCPMADLFENPAGLDGFEFIEFSAPEKGVLEPVFETMGFTKVARHRSKDVELWRQGGINLITNYEPNSPAWYFSREHGPSACGMGFRVKNARAAYDHLLKG